MGEIYSFFDYFKYLDNPMECLLFKAGFKKEIAVKSKDFTQSITIKNPSSLNRLMNAFACGVNDYDGLINFIDEIESVADADMVKQLAEKKKAKRIASSAGEMMEIIPDDDDDQIDGQMNLEDILNEWEGEAESLTEDTEPDDLLEIDDGEELSDLDFEAVEEIEEETELPEADAEEIEEEAELPEADAEEIEGGEDLLEADAGESIIEETAESDIEEETEDNLSEPEGESEGETMEDQKTKKTEPILPPDIQRMIDEIEGVIPPQEEEEKAPVRRTLKRKEEPRENMGKVADSLRMDDEDVYSLCSDHGAVVLCSVQLAGYGEIRLCIYPV